MPRNRAVARLLTALALCALSAGLFAQTPTQAPPAAPPQETAAPIPSATQIPTWTESDVLFVLDASPTMDAVDAPKRRLDGIRKCLAAFTEHDRVGFMRLAAGAETVAPLTEVSDANRATLENAARAATATAASSSGDLIRVISEAATMLKSNGRSGVTRAMVLISSASLPGFAETRSRDFRDAVLSAVETARADGIRVHVVSMGANAGYAQMAGSAAGKKSHHAVARSEELVGAFGAMLASIQAITNIPKQTDVAAGQPVVEEITVAPNVPYLQVDVHAMPDAAGAVPLTLTLTDPDGVPMPPRLSSAESAFYRLANPKPGVWRYRAVVARPTEVAQIVVVNSGLQVVTYFPSLVLYREKTPLVFGVRAPDGPVQRPSFRIGGKSYRVVSAEVSVTDPDGDTRVLPKPERERRRSSPMAGEFVVDWSPRKAGEHTLRTLIRFRRGEGRYLIEDTRKVRVTDKESELPLVALRAPEGGALLPVAGQETERARGDEKETEGARGAGLEIVAQVVSAGNAPASPFMLGRFLEAVVDYSPSLTTAGAQNEGGFELGAGRKTLGEQKDGSVPLFTDMTIAGTVQYTYPGRSATERERIYLDQPGYYRVTLEPTGAYRLDKARSTVILRAGSRDFNATMLGLLVAGGVLTLLGLTFYILVERGVIWAETAKPVAVEHADVLLEEERFQFIDVLDTSTFDVPLNIPYEIALVEDGALVNHTFLEHESLLGANYVVKVIHGETRLNGAPLSESLDIHMMPGDVFSMGKFAAEIVGIETPVLVIQFQVTQPGGYQFVNAITEAQHFRWTMTGQQPDRVPPQAGRTIKLDFSKRSDMLIGRDEGFTFNRPTDIPLYHTSVGEPHALLKKIIFMNKSVGYSIEAVKGTVYVGERRLQPGESVDEFHSGTIIGIGKFKLRMDWPETGGIHPTLEVIEAPAGEEMPVDATAIAAGATATDSTVGDISDLSSLDSFDSLPDSAPSAPSAAASSDSISLDAFLGSAPAEPAPAASAPAAESLDDLLAAATNAPAAESLDDLLAAAAPQETPADETPAVETPAADDLSAALGDLFSETAEPTPEAATPTPEPTMPEPAAEELSDEFVLDEAVEAEELEAEHAGFSLADLLSASDEDGAESLEVPRDETAAEAFDEAGSPAAVFAPSTSAAPTSDADRDTATGFLTPTRTERELADEWQNASEADIEMSIVLIDFERILNRPNGQTVMSETASLVQEQFGDVATLGRLDNERLVAILPNVPEAEAYEVADAIRESLSDEFSPATTQNILYGIASRRAHANLDPDTLIQELQDAMHQDGTAERQITVFRQA